MSAPLMPRPRYQEDRDRWLHSALRRRILTGSWDDDLRSELGQFFAPEVLARMQYPDLSRNPLRAAVSQLAVTYDEPATPIVVGVDEQPDLSPIVTPRLWPLRQEAHYVAMGCNESLVRLDWDADRFDELGAGIDYRVVWPDHVVATPHPDRLDTPVRVEECRMRWPSPDVCEWTWETWDVSDPSNPIFRIEVEDAQTGLRSDATSRYYSGEGYPYRDRAGRPILPYVLVHRAVSNRLWNYRDGFELVEATLKAGCLYTFWLYGVRDCAHPQRVGLDVRLPNAQNLGPNQAEADRITLDQSSILLADSKSQPGSGSFQTLEPTMDPSATLEAIGQYVRGALADAGLGAGESDEGLSRVSGYALVVSREALRKSQRRQIPACQLADQQLFATAARLVNAYEGTDLPERPSAYGFSYHGVGKSLEEVRSDVERIAALRSIKPIPLISQVDAMLVLHPHMTPDQARIKLDEIVAEMAQYEQGDDEPEPQGSQPAELEDEPTDETEISDPSNGTSPSGGRAMAQPSQETDDE